MSAIPNSPNPEQLAALQRFANKAGRAWKNALSAAWTNGSDSRHADGALLRQIRNEFGPDWLYSKLNAIKPIPRTVKTRRLALAA